ncbi:MAG TPA: PDZ domain-containing protein, partial [Holophaga sp.]|nr:PDZ domain-containing protein [Holophaga sp.]
VPEGVIVLQVRRGGAAAQAGLRGLTRVGPRYRLGDVILGVNGKPAPDHDRFLDLLEAEPMGSTVQLDVLREGARLRVPFKLEPAGGQ